MNTDPKKLNPFKFLRRSGGTPSTNSALTQATSEQRCGTWPNIQRLFSRHSLRAMKDFFLHPFEVRGALERRFGNFSSSRFHPRINVVDEGRILRVTVELPGMEREDVAAKVEDGALVLRGEKKRDVHVDEDGCSCLEPTYRTFMCTIPMPEYADPEHTLAKFDNGVLTLTVPKQNPLRSASRTIEVG